MTWSKKEFGAGFAVGSLTIAVLGGAAWWSRGTEAAEAKSGESLELRAGKPAVAQVSAEELARLRAVESAHDQQVASLTTKIRELEARTARQPVVPTSQPVVKNADPAAPPQPARFGYPGLEQALAGVDWEKSGQAIHKLAGLLVTLREQTAKGEEPSLDLLGQIQMENGILVQQAIALVKHGVPGTGVNGSYTHPVVAANQLFATLADAKLPLDDGQATALSRLANHYAGQDDQRRGEAGPDALALRGTLAELELKDRFYAEARDLLTPQQRDLLFRSGTEDTLTGSLFSSGLVWATVLKATQASDVSDYASQVSKDLGRGLDLDAAGQQQLAEVTQRWAKQFPKELLEAPAGKGPLGQSMSKSRVRAVAERQAALLEELSSTLSLSPEQRKALRKQGTVRMPLITTKK